MLIVAAAIVVFVLGYVVECVFLPFAPFRCCGGTGRHHPEGRQSFRDCWWCKGSGRRLRVGRRLWNALKRRRDAGRG